MKDRKLEAAKKMKIAKKKLKEFKNNGYTESITDHRLLTMLRQDYSEYFRIFDAGQRIAVGKISEYGSYDLFGKRTYYYYDVRKEKEFVDFLVNLFYSKNPNADMQLQSLFTRALHIHGLCWSGCATHNRPKKGDKKD